MINKILSSIFLSIFAFAMAFSQEAIKQQNDSVSITFKLKLAGERKNIKTSSSIGIRGNTLPLSWDKTYPLSDKDKDGIYEATLTFQTLNSASCIQYKYFHDSASWETNSNRVICLKNRDTMLPPDTWNIVKLVNTQSYIDSLEKEKLYDTIVQLDSLLFATYNTCNLSKHETLFSEDIEFYHDRGGLTTSKKELMESVKNNICGKVRRILVKGSIEVSPIPGYGAVEMGSHYFYNIKEGSASGASKFVMIWQLKNGEWKLTRVISLH